MPVLRGLPRSRSYLRHVIGQIGELVELQKDSLTVAERNGGTFFHKVVCQAIYTSLWKLCRGCQRRGSASYRRRWGDRDLFTARFASVLVTIASVLELRAAFEEFQDELVGPATHHGQELASLVLFW